MAGGLLNNQMTTMEKRMIATFNSSDFWVVTRRKAVWNRRFGTLLDPYSRVKQSKNYLVETDVSGLLFCPIFKDYAAQKKHLVWCKLFGNMIRSHLQGSSCPNNYFYETDVSWLPIGFIFKDQTDHKKFLVSNRCFGTAYQSHLQGSSCPRKIRFQTNLHHITTQKTEEFSSVAAQAWDLGRKLFGASQNFPVEIEETHKKPNLW